MAGLFDSMKAGLTPVSLTGNPPSGIAPGAPLPTVISGPDWGEGQGKMKLTPETANSSAASVIR